ncbi:MAG: hypothetical protein VX923_03810 [Pseudomonadota bacterium]|nr:hypothetical protein [Pseudomonadota bacterium]
MKIRFLMFIVLSLVISNVVWVATSYLIYPGYLDHGEPGMALISWRLLDRNPAYLGFDSPTLISNVYGPLTYLSHALSFWLFEAKIQSGKVLPFLSVIFIPIFVYLSHRRKGSEVAIGGAILSSALILFFVPFSIWTRPESLMALLGVIAVWANNASDPSKPEWFKSILIAIAASMAVGMKLHAGIYFAPVVIFHCFNENRGIKTFFVMALVGLFVVFIPFLFTVFPITDFWAWIFYHLNKESPSQFVFKYFRYGLIFLSPTIFYIAVNLWSKKSHDTGEKLYFYLFIGCLLATLFPATKVGAGIYYFFPFLAVLIEQILRHAVQIKERKSLIWCLFSLLIAMLLIISIPTQKRFFRALHWNEVSEIKYEIRKIMTEYSGRSIEMGFGDNVKTYPRTYYRTLLVMAGHPYTLDAAPAMEMNMWKIPLTKKLLFMVQNCNTDIWLIPKDEVPFKMIGYYGAPTIDKAFREDFLASYKKLNSFNYFDIWTCQK